jgi:hypothetical protein
MEYEIEFGGAVYKYGAACFLSRAPTAQAPGISIIPHHPHFCQEKNVKKIKK